MSRRLLTEHTVIEQYLLEAMKSLDITLAASVSRIASLQKLPGTPPPNQCKLLPYNEAANQSRIMTITLFQSGGQMKEVELGPFTKQ
jgi:hypothetical protein